MRCRGWRAEIPGHPGSTDGIGTHASHYTWGCGCCRTMHGHMGVGRAGGGTPFRRGESQYLWNQISHTASATPFFASLKYTSDTYLTLSLAKHYLGKDVYLLLNHIVHICAMRQRWGWWGWCCLDGHVESIQHQSLMDLPCYYSYSWWLFLLWYLWCSDYIISKSWMWAYFPGFRISQRRSHVGTSQNPQCHSIWWQRFSLDQTPARKLWALLLTRPQPWPTKTPTKYYRSF